jgi:hypothetical protein
MAARSARVVRGRGHGSGGLALIPTFDVRSPLGSESAHIVVLAFGLRVAL